MLIQNFLFHRVLGEVKVLIQNFLFDRVLGKVKIQASVSSRMGRRSMFYKHLLFSYIYGGSKFPWLYINFGKMILANVLIQNSCVMQSISLIFIQHANLNIPFHRQQLSDSH